MKKTALLFLILFATISLLLPSTTLGSSNLKYFGYYYGVGSFDGVVEADLDQISQYSNTLVISTIGQLQAAYERGMKGIVVLSGTFWNYADRGADGKVNLHPDWLDNWDKKWQELLPHLSKIRALYPMDEPDINVRQEDYNQVVSKVKSSLNSVAADIPIMMTLSPFGPRMVRDKLWQVPPEIDWLGFDEYGCWEECVDGLSITDKLDILIGEMSPRGKNVFVIPDGFKSGNSPPTSTQQQAWVARNQNIFDLCATRNICIGMFTFLWPSLYEGGGLTGVQDMPVVEADLQKIGNLIINSPSYNFGIHAELPMVLANNQGISFEEQVQIIKNTGTGWVRQRVRWDKIEPTKGQFDWAELDNVLSRLKGAGLEPLLVLRDTPGWAKASLLCPKANICPPKLTDWTDFIAQIVNRYGYQPGGLKLVRYWEVWNEPNNLVMFTGTVNQYYNVLKTATEAIHQTDSSAKVLMGGVTHKAMLGSGNDIDPNWLDKLFAKPDIKSAFDIFNFHLYGVVASPEDTFVKVNEFFSTHNLWEKPIWITETNPSEHSEQGLADNLKTWHQRIFNLGAEQIFYFTLPNWCQVDTVANPEWCDENVYLTERRIGGLVKAADFRTQTLSYSAYQSMANLGQIPGDANGDGVVNGLDYIIWLNHYNQTTPDGASDGDFDDSGKVDGLDYVIWLDNYEI